jgi:hypothetical protein
MGEKHRITIFVEGGNVQSVHTTLPAGCDIEIEMLDFDNARVDEEDPDALDKAVERLATVEKEQRQIY